MTPRGSNGENTSGILVSVSCEFFGLAKFPFSLKPKLLISPGWSVIFFPDFAGAYSDVLLIGFGQRQCPLF